jgi:hypothetical protein
MGIKLLYAIIAGIICSEIISHFGSILPKQNRKARPQTGNVYPRTGVRRKG